MSRCDFWGGTFCRGEFDPGSILGGSDFDAVRVDQLLHIEHKSEGSEIDLLIVVEDRGAPAPCVAKDLSVSIICHNHTRMHSGTGRKLRLVEVNWLSADRQYTTARYSPRQSR